ncbi:MAG: type II secretion system F family protein [Candidatus Woesearchaeota archaeon]
MKKLKEFFRSKSNIADDKPKKKRRILAIYADVLDKAGFDLHHLKLNDFLLLTSFGISFLLGLIISISGVFLQSFLTDVFIVMFTSMILVFIFSYFVLAALSLAFLDVLIYRRIKQIEEHLPDFLQLASANISSGMPIDRALWFSVRSKFGVLAEEIEQIAKATIAGEDLQKALKQFADKYDSKVLKETMSLIIESIGSGGELAGLLNKISENIYETRLMKKEIGASVMTYVIFIGTASVFAAPILLALSTELLHVIKDITANLDFSGDSGFFSFSIDSEMINVFNFQVFSIVILLITSFFSACIISSIRRGNIKEGLKLIPVFMVSSLIVYFLAIMLFSSMMGGLF